MELDLNGIYQLAREQEIDTETVDEALSEALRLAYLKTPHAAKHARVELDPRAGTFTIWAQDEIPQEPTEDDPHPAPKLGEEYDDTPNDFGRLAAATARQVIQQLFRKAEDDKIFGAFSGQRGKLITGVVQQDAKDTANVHVAVGDVEAILPRREQVPGERYRHGERIRVYVVNVSRGLKGPEIIVSRSHPELVRRLFEREVPELVSGAVSIMAIAREAGARTKIAVRANTPGVNPKGALIGPGGSRVRAVMENLGPEKIDIVDWSNDPATFVAAALSPAVVSGVQVISEKNQTAIAFIHDDQLSLAIGKEGQNARLAARLTGYKIDIKSETQAKDAEGFRYEDYMFDEDGDVYYEEEYEEGEYEESGYDDAEYDDSEYDDAEYAGSENDGYAEAETEEGAYDASAEETSYEEETEA